MKSSDKEALVHECLVKNYGKYYKIAYSYTFHEQDAMDVVQEGAYRAILKSDSLKQPEYADTWICRIMIREAIRFLEKKPGKDGRSGGDTGRRPDGPDGGSGSERGVVFVG